MRHVLLVLFHLASSCASTETAPPSDRGATTRAVGIHDALVEDTRLRGVVTPAHRGAASWGGATTLLRLAGAEPVYVLVPTDGLEPGALVTLRGTLRALDARETTFEAGLEPELGASTPLLVALRLDGARVDGSEGTVIETVADLTAALPTLRAEGTLLGDASDGSLRLRVPGGSPVCVRLRVVAEDAERFRALEGSQIAVEGSLRVDGRPTPEPSAECWPLHGLFVSQPRLLVD